MEKLFPTDILSKRERVERTLRHEPVDRVALHDQLSYNPGVVAQATGKPIQGFDYTLEDICLAIRRSLDMCFRPAPPRGKARFTTHDGFVYQQDEWTSWRVSRPFSDAEGARDWLLRRTREIQGAAFDAGKIRASYRYGMLRLQELIGDTVIFDYGGTGFCTAFDSMGLELFVYFCDATPEVFADYMEASAARAVEHAHAVADPALSPVYLIAEDFATKQGPIFSPAFLRQYHYPYVRALAEAWHEHGLHVLYHSDGNYKAALPDLIACGVDGFYCLEPGVGMEIVALKQQWPEMVWAGGVDGVDLMERGLPEEVRAEVRRHILETDALRTGGMFVGTSSEVNPPIRPENFRAMVDAVGELRNLDFSQEGGLSGAQHEGTETRRHRSWNIEQ